MFNCLKFFVSSVSMSATVQQFLSVWCNNSFICLSFHFFKMMTVYWHALSMLEYSKGTN